MSASTISGERRAELEYQAARAQKIGLRPTPEYVVERYRRTELWRLLPLEYLFHELKRHGAFRGRRVMDFGCGEGLVASQMARLGARVTAVDMSRDLIDLAREQARLDGVAGRIDFVCGDIVERPLAPAHYDFVVCEEVLHHVDIRAYLPQLVACLKPGGMLMIQEPAMLPPALQRLRDALPIPTNASPREWPLNDTDFEFISDLIDAPQKTYFHMTARLMRLFPNRNKIDNGHPITKAAVVALTGIDRILLELVPSLRPLAGIVVLTGRKPVPALKPVAALPPHAAAA